MSLRLSVTFLLSLKQHFKQHQCIFCCVISDWKGKAAPFTRNRSFGLLCSKTTSTKLSGCGLFTIIIRKHQAMRICILYKYPDTTYLVPTTSTSQSSCKQLLNTDGKLGKCFQVAISLIHYIIKKKIKRNRNSEGARGIARKARSRDWNLSAKDLQEDLADSGVVVHCSTVQWHLYKYGFSRVLATNFSMNIW